MCIGVPSKIVSLDTELQVATVESLGQQRVVSLMLLEEMPAVGDYLMIQAGGFAAHRVSPEDAQQALAALKDLSIVEATADAAHG